MNSEKLRTVWKESLILWPSVLGRAWPWITFLLVYSVIMDRLVNELQALTGGLMFLGFFVLLLSQLVFSVVGIIVVSQITYGVKYKKEVNLLEAIQRTSKPVCIESLRAMLPVALKCLLILVPGFIESMRLYFVPLIAQFDQEYLDGNVDALKKSRKLCLGRLWPISAILILSFFLSILPRFWLGSLEPMKHWLDSPELLKHVIFFAIAFFVSLSLELYSDILVYCLYDKLNGQNPSQKD